MGVCTEERPVMHWQSARFLGPAREKNPTPTDSQMGRQCSRSNNNHLLYHSCSCCSDACEHSTKSFSNAPIFSESFQSFETPERAVFDESSIKYSISGQTECPDLNDENAEVSLKTEPFGPSSSPELSNGPNLPNSNDCAGCSRIIKDRFYLSAAEKRWHVGCLQCCACRQPLDRECSCFSRGGNIYCKSDYYRLFGTKRCSRCLASISSSELVMRVRSLVFHVSCFCCAICNTPLTKGDQFGIRESLIYCRTHFGIALEIQTTPTRVGSSCSYTTQFGTPPDDSSSPHDPNRIVPTGLYVPASHVISGLPQQPRQKGRPRKRKPKDIDVLTANIDLNTEYLDFGRGSHMSASSRTKRMRTSFKHHQLRTMKSYFAINHNPDAKDLKQLSQKTGLPKRVLQVWFQNARAKWRRMMMKQDGSNINDKGDGSLDLDSFSAHSPSSFMIGGTSSPHTID